jgi:starch synthase
MVRITMRIAHLSAEVAPFAKTGGLGDVVGALPKYQAALGHDVQVYMPLHRDVWKALAKQGRTPELATDPFRVRVGPNVYEVGVMRTTLADSDVPLFLIGQNEMFDRPQVYSPDYFGRDDGIIRFSLFVRAAMATMERLWLTPDILNAHDWHTALAPMAIRWDSPRNWVFNSTRTVLTIHNLAYQGAYTPGSFDYLGLPHHLFNQVEFDGATNLMKGGIVAADAITTVSPTFGREIMSRSGGFGLDGMLRMRSGDFAGILNGIDTDVWNPAKDKRIATPYDINTIEKKVENKRNLLSRVGMDPDDGGFVVGVVGRLTEQKGFDLLFPVLGDLLQSGVRVVFLGSGEKALEEKVGAFSYHGQGRFWGYVGYNEDLAHVIEAGVDAFLMPSRFEPCGLNQMYSLAYGTPPIVRMVGGLADTVVPYNGWNRDVATGFGFDAATPSALRDTVLWARHCYHDPLLWTQIARNGMEKDFSWWRSAEKYLQVYEAVRSR